MDIRPVGNSFDFNGQIQNQYTRSVPGQFKEISDAIQASDSSDNGKAIGLTAVGNKVYVARYADSSTDAEPVIKVGDYEIHVNQVDPNYATEAEMFALMSYMQDIGKISNQGIHSYTKMKVYAEQAQYNGDCSGIHDEKAFWDQKRDWAKLLESAKQTYLAIPEAYFQAIGCEKIIESFHRWKSALQVDNNSDNSRELFLGQLQDHMDMMYEKIINGDTEEKFQIGSQSMSIEEWDELLEKIDQAQEDVIEAQDEIEEELITL